MLKKYTYKTHTLNMHINPINTKKITFKSKNPNK